MSTQICTVCNNIGKPKKFTPGSIFIEIFLWLFFILPGLLYSIWRLSGRYEACGVCGAPGMIPANSPRGRQLMRSADAQKI